MSTDRRSPRSYLFLVRVQATGTGEISKQDNELLYGRVQHVVTGEAYDFRGWRDLIRRLDTMLDNPQNLQSVEE
jgi:hypothetical protein